MRRLSIVIVITDSTQWILSFLLVTLFLFGPVSLLCAAITPVGDVVPTDTGIWASGNFPYSQYGYVGQTSDGTLTVDAGSQISSEFGYIGYNAGVMGDVNIEDPNSTWTSEGVSVGVYGIGILAIKNGGTVIAGVASTTSKNGYIGCNSGSSGTVTVTGSGSKWINNGSLIVGVYGNGTLNIAGGGTVTNISSGCIASMPGVTSTVVVEGAGSTWSNTGEMTVGRFGNGTLSILNGSAVTVGSATTIGENSGSAGTIHFGAHGGTLTTQSLYASPAQLTGTGTINTGTLVSDLNLVFDATHGLTQTLTGFGDITVNLALANTSNPGDFGVGWQGCGSLAIKNGMAIRNSGYGYIGENPGSAGIALVEGSGSRWSVGESLRIGWGGTGILRITHGAHVNSSVGTIGGSPDSIGVVTVMGTGSAWMGNTYLNVGHAGSGTLNIHSGGSMTSGRTYIGCNYGSMGVVRVDGSGSSWSNDINIQIGELGSGMLCITGGATVTTRYLELPVSGCPLGSSLLAIDVGRGSSLTSNDIENYGIVRILAGAGVVAGGSYTPIQAKWVGSGAFQAVGGTLDVSTHQFTVSEVVGGTAGTPVKIDLALRQRVLIGDSENSSYVGASFLAAASSSTMTFTATTMGSTTVATLEDILGEDRPVLGAWDFTAEGGYAEGDPAYLSFDVGPGYSSDGLRVWHYDGSEWTPYDAIDLTYDGTYASFTVTGFSGYAVAVPEPTMLAMLGFALAGLATLTRKKNARRR